MHDSPMQATLRYYAILGALVQEQLQTGTNSRCADAGYVGQLVQSDAKQGVFWKRGRILDTALDSDMHVQVNIGVEGIIMWCWTVMGRHREERSAATWSGFQHCDCWRVKASYIGMLEKATAQATVYIGEVWSSLILGCRCLDRLGKLTRVRVRSRQGLYKIRSMNLNCLVSAICLICALSMLVVYELHLAFSSLSCEPLVPRLAMCRKRCLPLVVEPEEARFC